MSLFHGYAAHFVCAEGKCFEESLEYSFGSTSFLPLLLPEN